METVSEQFKKEHAVAERGGTPVSWIIQGVNLLNTLKLNGPYSGEQIRDLVSQAERRGVSIPTKPITKLTAVEVRSFTEAVTQQRQYLVIPGTMPAKTKVRTYSVDDDLLLTIREQKMRFEFELAKENLTPSDIDDMIAEKADPLMRLVNARNPKRK